MRATEMREDNIGKEAAAVSATVMVVENSKLCVMNESGESWEEGCALWDLKVRV